MNPEAKFVVNPLEKYFLDIKRSGAKWSTKHKPKFESSATGWDLQMERKNQVLLFEAKYIRGPFASAFAGLVIAPLTNKTEKMRSKKKKSWSSVVCWAIGSSYKKNAIFQILFDYLARNPVFWESYSKILKVKYIYFVSNNKVSKIRFEKIIKLAMQYKPCLGRPLKERKLIAEKLMGYLKFS